MTAPPPSASAARSTHCVVGGGRGGAVALVDVDDDGTRRGEREIPDPDLPGEAARREEAGGPRWVWSETAVWYPRLLAAGVRVGRCHDLRLAHAILSRSELVADPDPLREAHAWEHATEQVADDPSRGATLFDLAPGGSASDGVPHAVDAALAEYDRQLAADEPSGRLRLLLAAESVGALAASEMQAAGIPWDVDEHDRILTEALGPRVRAGQTPSRMVQAATEVREALGDPQLSLDSPPRLLRALHRAEIDVASTSQWELTDHDHPAIEPLLRYKKMARLLAANGWAWLDEWVADGRYRPIYVPGGVVTGRWAASGGGALQIPRQLRPALRADPGWRLVSADVSQLEPRVLAAMSGDRAMAQAGAGQDLYSGIVEAGIVATRQEAKVGVLGALYGGTTGDSGRVVPRLRQRFPDAMRLVDTAAQAGERGGIVTTRLGRSSPAPEEAWADGQRSAGLPDATPREQDLARRAARDRGRFTRNFVVQGSAAEWALSWIGYVRAALAQLPAVPDDEAAPASGPVFSRRAHLVFFLHDEIVVHAPASQAEAAARVIRDAADAAGRLLFPDSPVDFPLDLHVSERASEK